MNVLKYIKNMNKTRKLWASIILLQLFIFSAVAIIGPARLSRLSVGSSMFSPAGLSSQVELPFNLAVNMGQFSQFSPIDKFGYLPETAATADPVDVWEFGDTVPVYPFDADNTAPIVSLSSSDVDDDVMMNVQGLDINGYLVSQNITLNGQTRVALTTALWRVFRMSNENAHNLEGTVYCYTGTTNTAGVPADANVRAIVSPEAQQTLMAVYTVPMGFVGFLYRGEIGVELEGNTGALAEYAHCHYESRRFGKVFKVKKSVTCMIGGGSAVYQDRRSFPDVIPAKTDTRIRAVTLSQDMGLFATFDILLVKESFFSDAYLTAIGQPGY